MELTKTITITYIIMKKLFFLLITLTVATAASAATVNRQQARQQAAQFLQQHGAQLGTEPTTVRGRRTQATDQPLYVFNTANSRGFVVVSGDDRTDAILGYTLQGSYDDANVPPALQDWLDQMTGEIEALYLQPAEARTAANTPKAERQQVAIHAAIEPLIITTWNQGNTYKDQNGTYVNNNTDGIYNISLPMIGSLYTCTGCVATAGAQIMYYYTWPESTKEIPGYESGLSDTKEYLPVKVFEWNKMKTSYTDADANTEAAKAVADLMRYAGWAAHMNYGVDGSSSSQVTLAGNMVEYFDYAPNWKHVSRDSYSVTDWDELIYNELACGRPVIYDGSGRGGHAFICDGYDGQGFYHFNWGWGGFKDGYFKLQATNPDGAYGYPGYIFGNTAIIGLQPNKGSTPEPVNEVLVATALNPTLENTTVKMMLQNGNNGEYGFGLGMAELKDDGSLNILDDKYSNWSESPLPQGSWWQYSFEFDLSGYELTEGVHKLVPVSLLGGETKWKRCKPASLYYKVIVSEGELTITQHPTIELDATHFEIFGMNFPNTAIPVDVTVVSKEDDYISPLYFFASQSDLSNCTYIAGTAIPGGGSEDVRFYFTPDAPGTWNLWVATDESGNNVIGKGSVEIKAEPTGTVTLEIVEGTSINKPDGVVDYELTVKNIGDVPFYRNFWSHLWVSQEGGWGCSSANDVYTENIVIEPGEEVKVTLTFTGLTEGGQYCIEPFYPESYSSNNMIALYSDWYETRFTYTTPTDIEPDLDPIPGNLDGDEGLDADDVTVLVDYLLNGGSLPEGADADVDGNGAINIADVAKLIELILSSKEP